MTKTLRSISFMLCILLCFSMISTSLAVDMRASQYIDTVYGTISNVGGDLMVTFTIVGTGRMTSIGATTVYIKGAAGNTVATYRYTMDGYGYMMGSGIRLSSSITYEDAAPGSYYAIIYFKAANANGSDTDSYITSLATV